MSHLVWVYMGVKILSLAVKSFFDREKASDAAVGCWRWRCCCCCSVPGAGRLIHGDLGVVVGLPMVLACHLASVCTLVFTVAALTNGRHRTVGFGSCASLPTNPFRS